jgi:hypothetical protein
VANIKLTNLASYRTYFQAIAASHVAIDGYKWGDKDVVRNDARSGMPARLLWAIPYESARYGDKMSDNVHKTKQARIAYLITPTSKKFDDIEAAYDECEGVIEQIVAKILKDKAGSLTTIGDPPEEVWSLLVTNVSSWTTKPVQMIFGSTEYIGCELRIDFQDNTNLAYDATKWE